jgi:hypothetical protein
MHTIAIYTQAQTVYMYVLTSLDVPVYLPGIHVPTFLNCNHKPCQYPGEYSHLCYDSFPVLANYQLPCGIL